MPYVCRRAASPRRADARLGSAHARNFRGWMIRSIGKSRLQMRQYCRGVRALKANVVWMKRKKALERRNEPQQQSLSSGTRRRTAAACSSSCNNNSRIATHRAAAEIHGTQIQIHTRTWYVVQQRTTQWYSYNLIRSRYSVVKAHTRYLAKRV